MSRRQERIEPSFEPGKRGRGKRPPPPEPPDDDGEPPESDPPKRRRSWPYVFFFLFAWTGIIGGVVYARWAADLPDVSQLMASPPSHDITILDDKGRFIARRGLTQGALIDVKALPAYVPNAFIAIEDRRFRSHWGIDPTGLARAARVNLMEGHVVQGGSTITQQLAKNLFLKPERTFERKIQEAALALYLEAHYSKDQLLTLYLNRVYFGAGVYGVEAASQRFFNKHANRLSLPEAVMLAGSLKAPAKYNPLSNADASARRGLVVLAAMRDAGFISEAQRADAAATRPRVVRNWGTPGSGYFVDWVIANLGEEIGETNEPVIIETTLDLDLQGAAERSVSAALAQEGATKNAGEAALVAMTPTGEIRAMMGGKSYAETPFNRVTDAWRQPGSSFKPFVYLAAFEHGHHADELMRDGPVTIGKKWRPGNYEGHYEGMITLTRAFAKSSNVVAAQLAQAVGPGVVVETAHRLGITSKLDAMPSIALGTSVVTPLELTQGYAAFANGGMRVNAFGVTRIRTRSGKVLFARHGSGLGRVVSPENAAAVTRLMVEVVASGTGKAAKLDGRDTAGKSGTTQDFHDAWFIGFSADYVCGVWFGNDDSTPMKHVTGGTLPAHLFKSFMEDAEQGLPPRPLTGLTLVATAEPSATEPVVASRPAEPVAPANDDKPETFEGILDKLFGGT
ncbi:MAG TPA: PBP1A family penicillin-binding protein [Rhizomicrobium sp.]|jgi:penicillin-binding protein 1A